MTRVKETEVIRKYAEAFNNRDLHALVELFAEEAEIPISGAIPKLTIRAWLKTLLISAGNSGRMYTGTLEGQPAIYTQFPGLHNVPERRGYGTVKLDNQGLIIFLEWADDPVNALNVEDS